MSKYSNKVLSEKYRSESKCSDLSDLSLSTDNKVFGGAINLLNKNNPCDANNNDNLKFDQMANSEKNEQNSNFSTRNFCFDDKKININEIIENSDAFEPITFRPSTRRFNEEVDKNFLENTSHQEYSTNSTIQNTVSSSKNSGNKFALIKNELNNNDKDKKIENNYIKEKNLIDNKNNFIKDSVEEKEIYSEIEEEVEEITNLEAEHDVYDKNVFWNLKNNVTSEENINNHMFKKCESNLETQCDQSKIAKSSNSSQITCVFSRVEKCNAIFVSSDDIIFFLPMSFLPKNAIPGNTYKITIEETEKIHKKLALLQSIQKNFLNLQNDIYK